MLLVSSTIAVIITIGNLQYQIIPGPLWGSMYSDHILAAAAVVVIAVAVEP